MPKIIHYREKCIGCNSCVEIDPKHWKICDKDGKSKLINSCEKKGVFRLEIDNVEKEKAQIAAENCPVSIIQVID